MNLFVFQVQAELKKRLWKWQTQSYLRYSKRRRTLFTESSTVTQISVLEKSSPKELPLTESHNSVSAVWNQALLSSHALFTFWYFFFLKSSRLRDFPTTSENRYFCFKLLSVCKCFQVLAKYFSSTLKHQKMLKLLYLICKKNLNETKHKSSHAIFIQVELNLYSGMFYHS